MKKIAFGCDHVGFMLKEDILAHLRARGIDVVDKGTCSRSVLTTRIMPARLHRLLSIRRWMAAS